MHPHGHCFTCGAAHADASWPKRCPGCGRMAYKNPLPVAVLLLPLEPLGLLVIERGIEPRLGQLALPGGYVDWGGESWQQAAARELREEAQVEVDPTGIRVFDVLSAPDGTILIFGQARPMPRAALPPFTPTNETRARRVIDGPQPMAFPLHTQVVEAFFRGAR
jgi:ADP-ribose pyrophosphatase YjhB (NUDIX family)